jgi:hypothetical protein
MSISAKTTKVIPTTFQYPQEIVKTTKAMLINKTKQIPP